MATLDVTRDVILDLLPLYVAGEASPDSQRLIGAFRDADPEVARAEQLLRRALDLRPEAARPAAMEAEARDLVRARRRAWVLRWLLAGAILFSVAPLSFAVRHDGRVVFWLLRDLPGVAIVLLVNAGVLWLAYLAVQSGRLRLHGRR